MEFTKDPRARRSTEKPDLEQESGPDEKDKNATGRTKILGNQQEEKFQQMVFRKDPRERRSIEKPDLEQETDIKRRINTPHEEKLCHINSPWNRAMAKSSRMMNS